MLRITLAALAGLIASMIMVMAVVLIAATALDVEQGEQSNIYLSINLLGSLGAAVAGGFIAQRISRRERVLAPAFMAAAMFFLTIRSVLGGPAPGQPSWYPAVLLILGPVGAIVGGLLARPRNRLGSAGDPQH